MARFTGHSPSRPRLQAASPWLALLLVGLLLLLGLALLPGGVLWHSDEGAKLLQLRNLRLDGIMPVAQISYPGRDLDTALRFVPLHPKQYRLDAAGNITLQWPLFLAVLTAPFYALLGMAGLYFWPLLGALGSCLVAWRLALYIGTPPRLAPLAIPLLGLATPLGFYSWLFFEHTLAAFLVAASVLLLLRGMAGGQETETRGQEAGGRGQETVDGAQNRTTPVTQRAARSTQHSPARQGTAGRLLFAAGGLLGLAIYLRSELYVLAAVCAVLLFGRLVADWRGGRVSPAWSSMRQLALLRYVAGLLLALLPLWAYYAFTGGGILPYHATWYFAGGEPVSGIGGARLPEIRYLAQAGLGVVPAFLVGPDGAGGPEVPTPLSLGIVFFPLLLVAAGLLPWLGRWRGADWRRISNWLAPVGLGGLALCCLPVLLSPTQYPNLHGFLLAAPFLALAGLAIRPGTRKAARTLAALCLLYIGGHVLVISALSGLGPISTYEWGQRYILPAYPLLVPLALLALSDLIREARARNVAAFAGLACAALLALIGAGFLLRGWTVLDAGKREIAAWQKVVAANDDTAILTPDWALPLLLAPEFSKHRWYLVPRDGGATLLLDTLGREKLTTIALASLNGAPPSIDLPLLEQIDEPGGFSLLRYGIK